MKLGAAPQSASERLRRVVAQSNDKENSRVTVGETNSERELIVIKNVSKTYVSRTSTVKAVEDISVSIDKGDFVVVVGASGCGKTTLLSLIAGFITADSGEIYIRGQRLNGPGPDRAVVFQKHALYEWLSVRQNVEFGLKLQGMGKTQRRARANSVLELVGLSDCRQARVYELSGGMQQRVGLARALATDPEVLLLDEPFGALDAIVRRRLQDELLQLWSSTRKTFVLITHSVEEAVLLGTKVIVMGPKPGTIGKTLDLHFGAEWPGMSSAKIRASREFHEMCDDILAMIEGDGEY